MMILMHSLHFRGGERERGALPFPFLPASGNDQFALSATHRQAVGAGASRGEHAAAVRRRGESRQSPDTTHSIARCAHDWHVHSPVAAARPFVNEANFSVNMAL